MVDALKFYVPVLVDGDVEKGPLKKYNVPGYPTVKFMTPDGTVIGEMGRRRQAAQLAPYVQGLLKDHPPQFTKAYRKVLKARLDLDKQMARKKYSKAISVIAKIEDLTKQGQDYKHAQAMKKEMTELAKTRFDEAKQLVDSNASKAKRTLKRIARDFKGLDIAKEADKLASTL